MKNSEINLSRYSRIRTMRRELGTEETKTTPKKKDVNSSSYTVNASNEVPTYPETKTEVSKKKKESVTVVAFPSSYQTGLDIMKALKPKKKKEEVKLTVSEVKDFAKKEKKSKKSKETIKEIAPDVKCADCRWLSELGTNSGDECLNPYKDWEGKDKFRRKSDDICSLFKGGNLTVSDEKAILQKQNAMYRMQIEEVANRCGSNFWSFNPDMVKPPVKGEWIITSPGRDLLCSLCGFRLPPDTPNIEEYASCPKCGAEMRKNVTNS